MPDDALLAETNRLLDRILTMHAEQKAENDRTRKDAEKMIATSRSKANEAMTKRLLSEGLPNELATGSDDDWETRLTEATRRTQANLETLRERDETYRQEMLRELKTQSELLRRIAERLEA